MNIERQQINFKYYSGTSKIETSFNMPKQNVLEEGLKEMKFMRQLSYPCLHRKQSVSSHMFIVHMSYVGRFSVVYRAYVYSRVCTKSSAWKASHCV